MGNQEAWFLFPYDAQYSAGLAGLEGERLKPRENALEGLERRNPRLGPSTRAFAFARAKDDRG